MECLEGYHEVRIRKPHKCWGCFRRMHAGTKMKTSVWKDGGKVSREYLCAVCEATAIAVLMSGDEFGYPSGCILMEYPDEWEAQQARIERQATLAPCCSPKTAAMSSSTL